MADLPRPIWKASPWLGAAAIGAATLAAYAPALSGHFVWNDADYVTRPALQSLRGLAKIWLKLGATEQYYPVLHSAFWVEHRLWGDNPFGYHLVNVVLHAIAACLFARLVAVIGTNESAGTFSLWPWFAGFLFALHPMSVESVAWISEQKNTLSTVFYLLSALAFLRWRGGGARPGRYWLATILFLLALGSKTTTATLPAALGVVAWWRRGRLTWRDDVRPLLPWFVLGAAGGLFSAWVERTYEGAQGAHFALSGWRRCLVAGRAVGFYLSKLVWPFHLSFIYPRWRLDPRSIGQELSVAAVVVVLAVLVGIAVRGREGEAGRASRAPLACALLFIGSLFPTLGFLNVYAFVYSFVADHWAYLALFGPLAAAAAAWEVGAKRFGRRPALGVAITILAVLGAATARQARTYADVETLYRTTLDRNPDAWMVANNLGSLRLEAGRGEEALAYFSRAAALEPDYPEIQFNLGDAYAVLGRRSEAIAAYEAALRLEPNYALAHANLATTLLADGRPREAIPHFEAALAVFPRLAKAHFGLGEALERTGRLAEAAAQYAGSLQIDPNQPEVRWHLGNTLGNLGHVAEAAEQYREALRLRPDYPEARANLGLALADLGRLAEAEAELTEALRLRPGYAEGRAYLGVVLAQAGRFDEAISELRTAVALSPRTAAFHEQLGQILRAAGRPDEAEAEFSRAAQLGGRDP